jgi:hypothetical protein
MSSGQALPSGTVTFLFTDIEGSTRLVKSLGDGYEHVLAEHQTILRVAFAEHGGHEIDTQGATRSSSPSGGHSSPGGSATTSTTPSSGFSSTRPGSSKPV